MIDVRGIAVCREIRAPAPFAYTAVQVSTLAVSLEPLLGSSFEALPLSSKVGGNP
jgi:hypothetical protein